MAKRETINIAAAKARLPELVERASNGEEIILARNGRPKAKLVAIREKKRYVFEWWDDGSDELGAAARRTIRDAESVYVSAVSEWELSI